MRYATHIVPLLVVVALPAAADDVFLKNGRVFEDVIAEVQGDSVHVQLAFGEMRLSLDSVDRIEQGASSLVAFQERRAALATDPSADAAAWLELARWALGIGLNHSAREAALLAAELDPGLEGLSQVMRRLDYVFEDELGRWVPFEESMRLRGFEKVDGTWLSAEQRLALGEAEVAASRQHEADQERRLTQAVLALAAAQLVREPEPEVVQPWPAAVYPGSFVWYPSHPHPKPPPHPAPHGDSPFALPIEQRQPGSLFPIKSHHGGFAGAGSGGS